MTPPLATTAPPRRPSGASLLTTRGRLLVLLAEHPDLRVREIAEAADVTERTVTTSLRELEQAGLLVRHREGRKNIYRVAAPELLVALRAVELAAGAPAP